MAALPPQLQNAINQNQGDGANYGASLGVDGTTQGQVANDYATGAGLVQSGYQTGNSAVQKSHSAVAFVGAWGVLADPSSSPEEIVAATAVVVVAAEGALFVVEDGLLVVAGISMSVPVLGWIVAAVAVVLAALTALGAQVWNKIKASGNPIIVSQTDQVNAAIYSVWKQFPAPSISQNPFTPRSRQVAAYFAAYVQTMRAQSGLSSWCSVAAPAPNAFGYQCMSTDVIRGILAQESMLGSGNAADAALLTLSVLWDSRWRGNVGTAGDPDSFLIGIAGELDPNGGANPEVGSVSTTGVISSITDVPGMSAAAYLCEILAVAALQNAPNTAQGVYLATYLRLVHGAWLFESFGLGNAASMAPVYATIGFLSQELVSLGGIATQISTSIDFKPTVTASVLAPSAYRPAMNTKGQSAAPTLAAWVAHYNAL